ncbi:MAG: GDP-mannose 4,6-dehydratase [Armatimonadota bacterium]|nr:GDP-mannose 4,6-dehydratase [Armatimonadota bacterium]MCX7777146.1 GDP-mannose 4,6-dehydratase [Armatimonadota bacterium]MDW8025193.1 GDP-mannose 4,6-dehydratase [Armatimonadota bacterium]
MSVMVTGGAGFIGSHLVERLLGDGYDVVCVDNFDDFYSPSLKRQNVAHLLPNKRFHLVEADIRDIASMRNVFERYRPRKVVHLAALAGVLPSLHRPLDYNSVNITGTWVLLELCCQFSVEQFIFGSSSSVYGASSKAPFKEDDPAVEPISPYGATKRMGEILCYTYHHLYGIPITSLRFFTVYGPRQRPDLAIHKFARRIMLGQPVPIYGDGTSLRDYTYIDDIVEGIMASLEKVFPFEIANLGCGHPVVLMDVVKLLEENIGRKAILDFQPMPPCDPPLTHADIEKAQKLLGYHPKVQIEEGIRRFVEWFLAHWEWLRDAS